MSLLEKYQELKKLCERKRREADRAQGALQQVLDTLKDKFNCSTVKEGEQLLKKLEIEIEKLEPRLQQELENLEDKYGDRI